MKSSKANWWIDAILYIGFLASFLLELTGVELHQWIGLFIGILAFIHLILHIDWVTLVLSRFFGKTSNSARLNLVIDAGIGLGFFIIVFTGVLISTWLNLASIDFPVWTNIHILASVFTLFTLLLKLVLHRKWIINVAEKHIFRRASGNVDTPAVFPVLKATQVNRREFLKVSALLGAGAVVGITQLHDVMENILFENTALPAGGSTGGTTARTEAGGILLDQSAADVSSQPQSSLPTANPTATPADVTVNEQVNSACTVLCPKGCSYPGRCRRYIDSNGNGKCDNGECL